jgi:hypothetical protein
MLEVGEACNSARKVPQEYLEYAGLGCTRCQLVVTEATQAEAVKAHPDYWKCPGCGRTAAHTWVWKINVPLVGEFTIYWDKI